MKTQKENRKKLLCIVGAGFSRAMNKNMPLSYDLIRRYIERAIDTPSNFQAWHVIAYLASQGFLGNSAKIKMIGESLRAAFVMHADFSSPAFMNYMGLELERKDSGLARKWRELIGQEEFKNSLLSWSSYKVESDIQALRFILKTESHLYQNIHIEDVLKLEEELGYNNFPESLKAGFDAIFYEDFQLPIEDTGAKDNFLRLLFELRKEFEPSFLSFNYDLILETILEESLEWNPYQGYGLGFDFSVDADELRQASERQDGEGLNRLPESPIPDLLSPFKVYKPHGSVNWLFDPLQGRLGLVLKKQPQDKIIVRGGDLTYRNSERGEFQDLTTILAPPVSAKTSAVPQLWSQDEKIDSEFQNADTIMVIGWGCPSSDQNWMRRLERIFLPQNRGQLENLIVINPDNTVLPRLQSILRAKHNHSISCLWKPIPRQLITSLDSPGLFGHTIYG